MFRYLNIVSLFRLFNRIAKYYITEGDLFQNYKVLKSVVAEGFKRIDNFVEGKKGMNIIFEDMVSNPRQVIEEIIDFLEIKPTEKQIREAIAFIDPNEIHN
jgi:uncharacterized membrane protein YukC